MGEEGLDLLLQKISKLTERPGVLRGIEATVRAAAKDRWPQGGPAHDRLVSAVQGFDARDDEGRRAALRDLQRAWEEVRVENRGHNTDSFVQVLDAAPERGPGGPNPERGVQHLNERIGIVSPVFRGLDTPLQFVKGVGPRLAERLAAKGLRTVGDALMFLPRRYEDRREPRAIADLRHGERAVVVGTLRRMGEVGRKRRFFTMQITDKTGAMECLWFNFHPQMFKRFVPGQRLVVSGTVKLQFAGRPSIAHPDLELLDDGEDLGESFGRIVPIYSEVEGLHARGLRRIMLRVVEEFAGAAEDGLPAALRERRALLPLAQALREEHFPPAGASMEALELHATEAHRRLVYDEFFYLEIALARRRRGLKVQPGISFDASPAVVAEAIAKLPFRLTAAQARAVDEIARDMARPEPMNRLLQGDVGSGKTAVAAVAALVAAKNGYQSAVMAPTEILAEQHYRTFARVVGVEAVEFIAAGRPAAERARALRRVAQGDAWFAIGTHALIEERVEFKKLGLAVIDEQHRFGVAQRRDLMQKGVRPDVLVMTATPIPRTLALTAYGDLDSSVLDELPPGRTPVSTKLYWKKFGERAYELVRREVAAGRQAYVVLPLVEESEKLADLKAATKEYERLASEVYPEFRLGLVHGRLGAAERNAVMERFRAGEIQVLVATTVIEVGVDVANASVMLIEHAERFGLSQLHQLRGRVGRGAAKSYCLLIAGFGGEAAKERLRAMEETTDGFRIAEEDLRLRGPGEFLGTRQHGLPDLSVADIARDQRVLQEAREDAFALVRDDPDFRAPEHHAVGEALKRWASRLSLAQVG
jgi:ATP-dependent DNA helicase RecG